MEPWRCFRVLNPGVRKENWKVSIAPLELLDEELIYEKEVPPGMLRHIIKELEENSENTTNTKKLLEIILGIPFNNKRK